MNLPPNSTAKFAPAPGKNIERIHAEHLLFAASDVAAPLLNALPEPAAILNEERQLVYANFAFLEAANIDSNQALLGLCVGELFGCVNAAEAMASQGVHPPCQACSERMAPTTSLSSRQNVSAITIKVADGTEEREMHFQHAMPIVIRGRCYSLIRIEPS